MQAVTLILTALSKQLPENVFPSFDGSSPGAISSHSTQKCHSGTTTSELSVHPNYYKAFLGKRGAMLE